MLLHVFFFYKHKNFVYESDEVLLSRTGYTGELGFEILGNHRTIINIWIRLIQSKVDFHHSFLFRRISDRIPQSISRLSKDWGLVMETTSVNGTAEPDNRVSFLDKYANELISIFQALPLDVQGLSIDQKRLVIFWNESQGAISKRKRLSNGQIEQKAQENLEPINVCFRELENLIDQLS